MASKQEAQNKADQSLRRGSWQKSCCIDLNSAVCELFMQGDRASRGPGSPHSPTSRSSTTADQAMFIPSFSYQPLSIRGIGHHAPRGNLEGLMCVFLDCGKREGDCAPFLRDLWFRSEHQYHIADEKGERLPLIWNVSANLQTQIFFYKMSPHYHVNYKQNTFVKCLLQHQQPSKHMERIL